MNAFFSPSSVLFSMFVASVVCLMLWLPTVTFESHYKRVTWHMAGGAVASLLLGSQFSYAAGVSLIVMLGTSDIGFALFVYFEERAYQRRVQHEDFEAARFMPSQFLTHNGA